ncbi:hypothetical protein ABT187_35360 [Streptomyces sp. NPDC001817]
MFRSWSRVLAGVHDPGEGLLDQQTPGQPTVLSERMNRSRKKTS